MNKFQITNPKIQINSNCQNPNDQKSASKNYDLEERSYKFAKDINAFCKKLLQSIFNLEYMRQVIKASGSVGANYIEANESLSRKDFIMRIKICRKEAKECAYWLKLIISTNSENFTQEGSCLAEEAIELKKIFSSIINKSL